jgi:hypothetical protein
MQRPLMVYKLHLFVIIRVFWRDLEEVVSEPNVRVI